MKLSLAGAAIIRIFVTTKVLLRLSRQNTHLIATNTCLCLSRQNYVCRSRQISVCRDKTRVLPLKSRDCRDKSKFVATKLLS